ncbi:hypothetical protein Taro_004270 [Colocasia esculenta]|uniref:Uncharacterized protein n=1 Tax=Colocasia esculenta TaxID=4460 RepID=A0A843TLU7_COLES|nr:hypothetical protein [Colocasia esculenta]
MTGLPGMWERELLPISWALPLKKSEGRALFLVEIPGLLCCSSLLLCGAPPLPQPPLLLPRQGAELVRLPRLPPLLLPPVVRSSSASSASAAAPSIGSRARPPPPASSFAPPSCCAELLCFLNLRCCSLDREPSSSGLLRCSESSQSKDRQRTSVSRDFPVSLAHKERKELYKLLSEKEVEVALLCLPGDKAPGLQRG